MGDKSGYLLAAHVWLQLFPASLAHYQQEVKIVKKKSKIEHYASEYAMSAGDNALSRKQINQSLVAPEFANEGTFITALEDGLEKSLTQSQ